MLELILWVATVLEPRIGLAIASASYFVGLFNKDAARDHVDRSCQTDPAEDRQELEGKHEDRKQDLEEAKKMSPYIWNYSYWPSEGGI